MNSALSTECTNALVMHTGNCVGTRSAGVNLRRAVKDQPMHASNGDHGWENAVRVWVVG